MHEAETLSLEQIRAFSQTSAGIRFEAETREQVYNWIERVLRQQQYLQQGRAARGLLRRYLEKMTGSGRLWHRATFVHPIHPPPGSNIKVRSRCCSLLTCNQRIGKTWGTHCHAMGADRGGNDGALC